MQYILDPASVKGESYPSETFRVLKEREIKEYGEYRTQNLVLEAWDRMYAGLARTSIAPQVQIDFSALPDGAWQRSDGEDMAFATHAQLAAIIKSLSGPTSISQVRLAALYALEPHYMTQRLPDAERDTWLRLVGTDAHPRTGATVTAFVPRVNAAWRNAETQLIGRGVIVEDLAARTWSAGAAANAFPTGGTWQEGRAIFILKAMENIVFNDATAALSQEDRVWVMADAA